MYVSNRFNGKFLFTNWAYKIPFQAWKVGKLYPVHCSWTYEWPQIYAWLHAISHFELPHNICDSCSKLLVYASLHENCSLEFPLEELLGTIAASFLLPPYRLAPNGILIARLTAYSDNQKQDDASALVVRLGKPFVTEKGCSVPARTPGLRICKFGPRF